MGDLLRSARESAKATKLCGYPLTVYWSRENENWLIYDKRKNSLLFEIETGNKINHNEIKRHLHIVRNRLQKKNREDNKYKMKKSKEKASENKRDQDRRELTSIQDFAGHKGWFQVPGNYGGK